ncbi:hypothetical protein KDD17_02095 [Sulfitobacter albidus]|uniref:Uncharacterized protein n=1 Tax=Sulfitobacter albidus TaxID=2829501 RepID=A0A975JF61_9RHOB|nr:hypothetical protein [Sulfitobacter albidus]QUJ76875.1 hypothetical protein KDD17_02095 [Sulfitobacter albidus]
MTLPSIKIAATLGTLLLATPAVAEDPTDAARYSQFLGTACILDDLGPQALKLAVIMAKSAGFAETMLTDQAAMLATDDGVMLTLGVDTEGGLACNNLIPGSALDAAGHDALLERTRQTFTSLYGVPEITPVSGGEVWRIAGTNDNTLTVQMTRQGDTTIVDARSNPGAP